MFYWEFNTSLELKHLRISIPRYHPRGTPHLSVPLWQNCQDHPVRPRQYVFKNFINKCFATLQQTRLDHVSLRPQPVLLLYRHWHSTVAVHALANLVILRHPNPDGPLPHNPRVVLVFVANSDDNVSVSPDCQRFTARRKLPVSGHS